MKAHGVKKVIASPGNTNISFVGSIQDDPYFQVYSCVDERSAAYMACGLAEESGEPVALSCTGATAARNYPSGLTEAYYRKLPILAITSSQPLGRVGQLFPQFTDRNVLFNDIATMSILRKNGGRIMSGSTAHSSNYAAGAEDRCILTLLLCSAATSVFRNCQRRG